MLFTISCPVTVRMLGHDVASVYVSEEIDDEDHLEEMNCLSNQQYILT